MRPGIFTRCISLAAAAFLTMAAAEYHGEVKFAGLPLPGVTVTATQGGKTLIAATDPRGAYSFADLPDGHWSLRAEKLGFSTVTQEVTAGDSRDSSFELKMLPLDRIQAIVQPPGPAFQRTSLTESSAPIAAAPAPELTSELVQRSADGFLINGSALNGAASAFSQSPAFGNARRHGPRLYTYAISLIDTNSALNAANYSLTGQHTPKPPFNNVTGTLSFSGPLKVPRLLPHNGPVLVVNYSRTENRASSVYTGLVPTEAERAGDLSQATNAAIYDPEGFPNLTPECAPRCAPKLTPEWAPEWWGKWWGGPPGPRGTPSSRSSHRQTADPGPAPFPGNLIPLSRISPQALSLLQYEPSPNSSGTSYNYQVPLIANTHTDNLRVALQKTVKRKNNLSGLLSFQSTRGDTNSPFQFLDLKRSLGINSSATYRRTFTPRLFGTFTYQFSRQSTRLLPFFANRVNVSGDAGITGNNQDLLNWGPPTLQFNQSSIAGLNDGMPSVIHNQTSARNSLSSTMRLDAAQKFIRTQMSSADLMAIMEYDGAAVEVLQDFTGDRERLQSIIATLIAGEADNSGDSPPSASASDSGAAFGQDDTEFTIYNTDRKLAALQTAAKMLGTLNEKKVLIYFTGGLNLNGIDNQAQLRATINDAIRAGVSFWPIDARGLVALPPLGDATKGSQGNAGMYTGAAAMSVMTNFQRSQDTLYTLADDTGGKAMLDSNNLAAGIVAAEQSITGYYIIGYYTTNETLDGKFRRVKITLNSNAEARLDYRQGYYSGKVFGKFNAADKERQLEDALMMGDPVTELTIALEVNYFRQNHAEYFTPIMVKIPGSELALARKRGAEHTRIDFIGEIKDSHGTTIQNMRDYMDIKLSDRTVAEWAKRPIEYDTGYNLLPATYSIKVLARDSETGRIGTYLGKFTIPNLDREAERVPITSVVLSSQRAAMSDAIATAGNAKKAAITQAANPLLQDGQKLIPSVTRVFSSRSDMYVYLQAYEPTAPAPLLLYVSFFQGSIKVMETPPVEITGHVNPKSQMLPLRLSFPLAKLRPGEYDCEVTVLDPASQKAAFWQAPIMVIP